MRIIGVKDHFERARRWSTFLVGGWEEMEFSVIVWAQKQLLYNSAKPTNRVHIVLAQFYTLDNLPHYFYIMAYLKVIVSG